LDNAGKTTILKKMADEDISQISPTKVQRLILTPPHACPSTTRTRTPTRTQPRRAMPTVGSRKARVP
jgi:hypothetical protein